MRATVMYAAGDVRVETVPDARVVEPPMLSCGLLARVFAAATDGPTRQWNSRLLAVEWDMRPLALSKLLVIMFAESKSVISWLCRSPIVTVHACSARQASTPPASVEASSASVRLERKPKRCVSRRQTGHCFFECCGRGLVADNENDQSATPDAFDVLYYIARKRLLRRD